MNRLSPLFRPPLSVTLSTPGFSFDTMNDRSRVVCIDVSKLRGILQMRVMRVAVGNIHQVFLARDYYRKELKAFLPYHLFVDEFPRFAEESEESFVQLLQGIRKFKLGVHLSYQVTAGLSPRLRAAILGNVGIIETLQTSADEAAHLAKELRLYEKASPGKQEAVEDIERAIAKERQRLRALGAKDSAVLMLLFSSLQRARAGSLSDEEAPQEAAKLRLDILQILPVGHAIVYGLPDYVGPVSVGIPEVPPVIEPFEGNPEELIEISKQNFGKLIEKPDPGPDESDDEEFLVRR